MANPSTKVNIILSLKDKMSKDIKRVGHAFNKMAVGAQRSGLVLGAAATIMGGGLKKAITLAAELDTNMRKVKVRLGSVSDKDLKMLTNEARRLGKTTVHTTAAVSDMMAELAQAGERPEAIRAMSSSVLDFAAATGVAANDAARFAILAATAFEVDTTDMDAMAHVMDVMTYSSTEAFHGVEDIGEALKGAAAIAKSTKQPMEDVMAVFTGLARSGIKGSSAETAFKNIMTRSVGAGKEIFAKYDIELGKVDGSMKSILTLMKELGDATANLNGVERLTAFSKAFGKIGLAGSLTLADEADVLLGIADDMKKLDSVTKTAAQTMIDGLGGAFIKLKNIYDDMFLEIGQLIAPTVLRMAETLSDLGGLVVPVLKDIDDLGGKIMKFFTILAGGSVFLLTLAGVATVVAAAVSTVGTLVGWVGMIGGALASWPALIAVALGAVVYKLGEAQGAWGSFMSVGKNGASILEDAMGNFGVAIEAATKALKSGDIESAFEIVALSMRMIWYETLKDMMEDTEGFVSSVKQSIDWFSDKTAAAGENLGFAYQAAYELKPDLQLLRYVQTGQMPWTRVGHAYGALQGSRVERTGSFKDYKLINMQTHLSQLVARAVKGPAKKKDGESPFSKMESYRLLSAAAKEEAYESLKNLPGWVKYPANKPAGWREPEESGGLFEPSLFPKWEGMINKLVSSTGLGAGSAASLASKIQRDQTQIQKDQLTQLKEVNKSLNKAPLVFWN